jgi:hypothetical protein
MAWQLFVKFANIQFHEDRSAVPRSHDYKQNDGQANGESDAGMHLKITQNCLVLIVCNQALWNARKYFYLQAVLLMRNFTKISALMCTVYDTGGVRSLLRR